MDGVRIVGGVPTYCGRGIGGGARLTWNSNGNQKNKFDNDMLKGLGLSSVQSAIHFATEPKAMQIAVVGNLTPKAIDLTVSDLRFGP
jgi:hypothetical protein